MIRDAGLSGVQVLERCLTRCSCRAVPDKQQGAGLLGAGGAVECAFRNRDVAGSVVVGGELVGGRRFELLGPLLEFCPGDRSRSPASLEVSC